MNMKTDSASMQPVFDALDAYVAGTNATTATATVSFDGNGVTHSMTAQDRQGDNRFQYSERTAGTRVSVDPVAVSLGPGQSQQFTATSSDPLPPFVWSMTTGAPGTLDQNGLYTAPATITAQSGVTITASTGQSWASASVNLQP